MPAIDVAALLKKVKANIKPMDPYFISKPAYHRIAMKPLSIAPAYQSNKLTHSTLAEKYGAPASTTGDVAYDVLSEIEGGGPNPNPSPALAPAAATKSSSSPAPATTTKATTTTTTPKSALKTAPKSATTNPATLPSRPAAAATPTPAKAGAAAAAAQKTATTKTTGKPPPGK